MEKYSLPSHLKKLQYLSNAPTEKWPATPVRSSPVHYRGRSWVPGEVPPPSSAVSPSLRAIPFHPEHCSLMFRARHRRAAPAFLVKKKKKEKIFAFSCPFVNYSGGSEKFRFIFKSILPGPVQQAIPLGQNFWDIWEGFRRAFPNGSSKKETPR